jgi:hypothetical protein
VSKKRTKGTLSWLGQGASDRALRKTAALHEAGHVVVTLAAGVEIDYVTLDDSVVLTHGNGAGNGFTCYAAPQWYKEGFLRPNQPWPPLATLDEEQRYYIFRRICVALAGELVERRLLDTGQSASHADEHEADDIGMASKWARYLAEGDMDKAQAIMDQATIKAQQVLDWNWATVEAIAQRLIARKRLTGDDLGAFQ